MQKEYEIIESVLRKESNGLMDKLPNHGMYDRNNTYGYFEEHGGDGNPQSFFKSQEFRRDLKALVIEALNNKRTGQTTKENFTWLFENYLDSELKFFGNQRFADNLIDNNVDLKKIKTQVDIEFEKNGLFIIHNMEEFEDILKEVMGIIVGKEDNTKISDLYKDMELEFSHILEADVSDVDRSLIAVNKHEESGIPIIIMSDDGAKALSSVGLGRYFVEKNIVESSSYQVYDEIIMRQRRHVGSSYESLTGNNSENSSFDIDNFFKILKENDKDYIRSFRPVIRVGGSVDDIIEGKINLKDDLEFYLVPYNNRHNEPIFVQNVSLDKEINIANDLELSEDMFDITYPDPISKKSKSRLKR